MLTTEAKSEAPKWSDSECDQDTHSFQWACLGWDSHHCQMGLTLVGNTDPLHSLKFLILKKWEHGQENKEGGKKLRFFFTEDISKLELILDSLKNHQKYPGE